MHPLKTTSAALAGVAVLALIAVQFAPWASFETSQSNGGFSGGGFSFPGFSFDMKVTSYTWNAKSTVNDNADTTSWYDSDMDDADGVGLIRTAVPILLVGTVVVLAGALVAAARNGATGNVVTLVGGLVLAIGVTLFVIGQHQFFDDADFSWAVSFYLAIGAAVLALTGGILGLLAGNAADSNATY